MRIYVAYTGGTIVMQMSAVGYVPDSSLARTLTERLSEYQTQHEFHVHCYEKIIDSSNATPAHWQSIGNDIRSRWSEFDAFLVLHGTDTMAYTSSALAYMFQNTGKPIVVTGSQIPLMKTRNDALGNVFGAIEALIHGPSGVFLFFGGLLLEGARARKVNTSDLQAFQSPNYQERGSLGIEWIWRAAQEPKAAELIQVPNMDETAVTFLMTYPGVQAAHWQALLSSKVKAAVLLSYGAGNGPDQNEALMNVIRAATARGVVIVNISQCGTGAVSSAAYATGSALSRAGVISGRDMTFEAAFVKLHFLLGLGKSPEQIRALIEKPLALDVS